MSHGRAAGHLLVARSTGLRPLSALIDGLGCPAGMPLQAAGALMDQSSAGADAVVTSFPTGLT